MSHTTVQDDLKGGKNLPPTPDDDTEDSDVESKDGKNLPPAFSGADAAEAAA